MALHRLKGIGLIQLFVFMCALTAPPTPAHASNTDDPSRDADCSYLLIKVVDIYTSREFLELKRQTYNVLERINEIPYVADGGQLTAVVRAVYAIEPARTLAQGITKKLRDLVIRHGSPAFDDPANTAIKHIADVKNALDNTYKFLSDMLADLRSKKPQLSSWSQVQAEEIARSIEYALPDLALARTELSAKAVRGQVTLEELRIRAARVVRISPSTGSHAAIAQEIRAISAIAQTYFEATNREITDMFLDSDSAVSRGQRNILLARQYLLYSFLNRLDHIEQLSLLREAEMDPDFARGIEAAMLVTAHTPWHSSSSTLTLSEQLADSFTETWGKTSARAMPRRPQIVATVGYPSTVFQLVNSVIAHGFKSEVQPTSDKSPRLAVVALKEAGRVAILREGSSIHFKGKTWVIENIDGDRNDLRLRLRIPGTQNVEIIAGDDFNHIGRGRSVTNRALN